MLKHVRYKGPGNEIFLEYHWQPEPGDERTIDIPDDATLKGHPSLEELDEEGDVVQYSDEEEEEEEENA